MIEIVADMAPGGRGRRRKGVLNASLASTPLCFGLPATIYVRNGAIVGGPDDGKPYRGTLLGTSGDDVIVGTPGRDLIKGYGGNDVICSLEGDDVIEGGDGNDRIAGGAGADILKGQLGDDTIAGGDGNDNIEGGGGNDQLDGNYARYLPRRLTSILNQTTPPDEIIFLDDASTDDSVRIAREMLAGSAVPHRIIRNETNQGCYSQSLRGLREATGDLVWLAEADDDCLPTLLEALTPAFDRDEVVLAYCQSKQIDGDGQETAADYLAWTADVDADKWRRPYVRRGIDEIRDSLIIKNTIPSVSAVVMRRADLSAIAGELVGLRNAGDWMVYLHVLEKGDIAFVPEALNLHRRHGRSVTIGKGGLNLMREILVVQRRALERHPVTATVEAKREACLQTTYEYLGLHLDGPVAYKDHEALKVVLPAAAR